MIGELEWQSELNHQQSKSLLKYFGKQLDGDEKLMTKYIDAVKPTDFNSF